MSMHESRSNISKLIREVEHRWGELQMVWNDANSHTFEERFIRPLVEDSRSAVGAMDYMNRILSDIKRDCG